MHRLNRTAKWSLLICGLGVAGCSSASSGGGTANFVGTWKYTSGTTTANCQGMTTSDPVTGNETVTKGSASDLVVSDTNCAFNFSVSGGTATAQPGQSCTTQLSGGTLIETVSSLVFTTSDGKTGHVSGTFNATESSGGSSVTCTVSLTGDLQKL
jgi:hypothetical protein